VHSPRAACHLRLSIPTNPFAVSVAAIVAAGVAPARQSRAPCGHRERVPRTSDARGLSHQLGEPFFKALRRKPGVTTLVPGVNASNRELHGSSSIAGGRTVKTGADGRAGPTSVRARDVSEGRHEHSRVQLRRNEERVLRVLRPTQAILEGHRKCA
jgi:hypothetical protein